MKKVQDKETGREIEERKRERPTNRGERENRAEEDKGEKREKRKERGREGKRTADISV